MSKNPFFLGKWSIKTADGTQVAQTKCVSGIAKFGLVGCIPNRTHKPTLAMFPCYELNKIEFSTLQKPGVIKPDNRFPFAIAQYGSNVTSAFQAFSHDFSFALCVAPGADAALALCCMAMYDDLAEWNAAAGFTGMIM